MANFNKVLLMGNLTRDPELKCLPSGTAVVEFGMAINRMWTDQQTGERREATTFVDCKAMGRQAEVINQYLRKGRGIFVEGRLDYRSWEAKDGSGRRSKLDVFVENFQFVGGRPQEGGAGAGVEPARRARPAAAGPGAAEGVSGEAGQAGESGVQDDDVPF